LGGRVGSENVGISSVYAGEIPAHRKSKVSLPMLIREGLVGPKFIPKGLERWSNGSYSVTSIDVPNQDA